MGRTDTEEYAAFERGLERGIENAVTVIGQLPADRKGNIKRWDAIQALNKLKDNG
jgi:hypothetical protein